MRFKKKEALHLTYIPSLFWNSSLSGFKLLNNSSDLPKNADFFIFWIESINSKKELSSHIKYYFPQIPIEKLLTCQINLVNINQFHQEKGENKKKRPKTKNYLMIVRPTIAKIIPIIPGIKILYKLNLQEEDNINRIPLSNSIKIYSLLTKLIFELLTRGSFIPILEEKNEKLYEGRWHLLLKTESDYERFNLIVKNSCWQAFNLPIDLIEKKGKTNGEKYELYSTGLWHPRYLFSLYLNNIGNFLIKYFLNKRNFRSFTDYYGTFEKKAVRRSIISDWGYKFLKSIIKVNAEFPIIKFHETIIPNIIKNWTKFSRFFMLKERNVLFNVQLELPENGRSDNKWRLRFSINIRDKNINFGIQELLKKKEFYMNHLSQVFNSRESFIEYILTSFGLISKIFPPLKKELEKEIPEKIYLTTSEVMNFIKTPRELLIQSGFNVIVPEAFKKGGAQRLSTRLVILSPSKKEKRGKIVQGLPSLFNVSSLLQYKWEISLEGKELNPDQKELILGAQEPLVNINEKWVLIEEENFKKINNLVDNKVKKNELGLKEDGTINYLAALKLGLAGEAKLLEDGETHEVVIEGDLNEIIKRLRETKEFSRIEVPSSFNGTLRDYQKVGLNWLANLCDLNFGVCLADDMGLGKTIQVIAYLLYRKEHFPHEEGAVLIICPTSVLFNWQKELEKFAPTLEYIVHHGPNRVSSLKELKKYKKPHLIILSTYATVRNDVELLEAITYQGIIVDESQNIKNYEAKQTQAIHSLISNYRICLSGTPIENRLLELWTLFEFLNPGLLETKVSFQKNYMIPIERYQDEEALKNLKMLIDPFILRRMKSDKSIIKDLPEKNEMKIYIKLTEPQIALYEKIVKETLERMELLKGTKSNTINLILSLLVKLKQICNHPYHFLKKEELDIPLHDFISQSNKLKRLVEMTEEIISNGEEILIFTQFKKMGDLIFKVLEQVFPFKILFFHGGIPEKRRKELVEEFQSESQETAPIMILSLKAGGFGLNLTQGTTVIHFDRWWNPSVEKQATDRAYRIGQKQTVNVYKFITLGTIEEKIDQLLEGKKELTEKIITSTSERWLAELDMEKFKELIMFNE
ncbi:MAG: SNF2-related protein [Promethearchaeota archaeon]